MKIISKINFKFLATMLIAILTVILTPTISYGISAVQAGANAAHGSSQPAELFGSAGIFTTLTNTMLFAIGALSVVMLIIGGFRYVVSSGNESSVTNAKNTILYAIIGLVIALLAYAAINFILTTLIPGSGNIGTNV